MEEDQDDDGLVPTWRSGNIDYDDRPLEISVDISSDEENEAEGEEQGTIFQSSQDTILQKAINDSGLLHEDSDNADEDEFLQEDSKLESEKISFSFLSGIDSTKTSTEIPAKNNVYELKTEQSEAEDSTTLIEDGSTIFNDNLSAATEPIVPGPFSEAAQASSDVESELRLRCDLCGKPMKGPSALREHYSITHFFEVRVVNSLPFHKQSLFSGALPRVRGALRVTPCAPWMAATRITRTGSVYCATLGQPITR